MDVVTSSQSTSRQLGGVEALIHASCTSFLIPEPPRITRSSSWISPPTLLQSSNSLIQNEIANSRCPTPLSPGDSGSSTVVNPKDSSLPPTGDSKRLSFLQRSVSYADRRPGVLDTSNKDDNSAKFNYSSASLGRPVKPKHNLSLQDNIAQYKSWLKGT